MGLVKEHNEFHSHECVATVALTSGPKAIIMFKMETASDGEKVLLRLSGRMQARHLEQLKETIGNATRTIALDLQEVTLVDLDVIRFLRTCESQGIELRHCAPYIREWIRRESARRDHDV